MGAPNAVGRALPRRRNGTRTSFGALVLRARRRASYLAGASPMLPHFLTFVLTFSFFFYLTKERPAIAGRRLQSGRAGIEPAHAVPVTARPVLCR